MPRKQLEVNVYDAAIERMRVLFAEGHRIVVSFSGGKDSGVAIEVCLAAMKQAGVGNGGRPQLDVVMRDEEILFPGSFEYAERMARRPEIDFHWIVANQPLVNVFNRAEPYFWVMDPLLDPEQWVRRPPEGLPRPAYNIQGNEIGSINTAKRFPAPEGKRVFSVLGLRTSESSRRLMGIQSSGGYICGEGSTPGMWGATPLYDWRDEDIWRAIHVNKWDMNSAYDVMFKMGVPKRSLRIAPPTMNQAGVEYLGVAAKAWPRWFDKVCRRLPGVRTAAQFGRRACEPQRKYGETWEQCFIRECIQEAPGWIADRSTLLMTKQLERHARHSSGPLPEIKKCQECADTASWKAMALAMYNGDPFSLKCSLPYVEPQFFRQGAGTWGGGKPAWT